MKKSYITTMPDDIGAFLQASERFASLGMNITRVSYNKAVDSHTLFIDVEGTPEQLALADEHLQRIGYLREAPASSVILIEFHLKDEPGSVNEVLKLICRYHFNISYMSSQQNNTGYQLFKMGLFVEDPERLSAFLSEAEKICPVRVIDYNTSEKVYDNSIFYQSFVSSLLRSGGLSDEARNELLILSNQVMQLLDDQGLSPHRTFDSVSKFAELLTLCRGDAFSPRVSSHTLSPQVSLTLIEPPCGSNTAILTSSDGQTLFIDSGYACYKEEMLAIFRSILPDFDSMEKNILITHADVDHCGLLPIFDHIYLSRLSEESLQCEIRGEDGLRERNPLHRPYIRICKTLTGYAPARPETLRVLWDAPGPGENELLRQIGVFDFADLHFEVYEARGGHLPGEILLIDFAHHIAFTGDVYVNIPGMTPQQKKYNQYAPILMTSVDTDPDLCARQRQALFQRLGAGEWQIFGAHGAMKPYSLALR